jgi:hypothetical protein
MGEEEQPIIVEETPPEPPQEVLVSPPDPLEEEEEREGPAPDHPRFKKVYAKWKDAERKISEIQKKMEEETGAISEMRSHNQKLVSTIEKLSNRTAEVVESIEGREKKGEVAAEMEHWGSTLESLEERKVEALRDGDYKSSIQIDKEIRKVERIMEKVGKSAQESVKPKPRSEDPPPLDPDIEKFTKASKWFNTDPIMTGAAKEYDMYLSVQPDWKSKPLAERLKEVKRVVEKKFAWQGTKPASTESGEGLPQGPGMGAPRRVKLSDAQIRAAEGLGLTKEEYAKQLSMMEDRI